MVYRVPPEWIAGRRRAARLAAPAIALLGIGILALALWNRLNWADPHSRTAAIFVSCVVVLGLLLGALGGRYNFRTIMRRWESFSVEVTPTELVRQMDGSETRIQRNNVASIREYPRGFVVRDKIGWQIFVPRVVQNYDAFRQEILQWTASSRP